MRHARFTDPAGTVRRGEWCDGTVRAAGRTYDRETVDVLPPTEPSKVLGVGRNYREVYDDEASFPNRPRIWWKGEHNVLAGHGDTVALPADEEVVYEAEVGVVVGTECRNVDPSAVRRTRPPATTHRGEGIHEADDGRIECLRVHAGHVDGDSLRPPGRTVRRSPHRLAVRIQFGSVIGTGHPQRGRRSGCDTLGVRRRSAIRLLVPLGCCRVAGTDRSERAVDFSIGPSGLTAVEPRPQSSPELGEQPVERVDVLRSSQQCGPERGPDPGAVVEPDGNQGAGTRERGVRRDLDAGPAQ